MVLSGGAQFPLGQGTLGSVIELDEGHYSGDPRGGGLHLETSVDKMCQGTSQQSGGRPWVVM